MNPLLYVMRHGSTGHDDVYNSPKDPPLDAQGRAEAKAAASYLKGKNVGIIYASVLVRTMQSAEIVADELDIDVIPTAGLDSLDIGDVADLESEEEADKIISHHLENPAKKMPNGESIETFRSHVDPTIFEGLKYFYETGKPALLSTHHSVEHEVGRLFNGDQDSALTETGGLVAVYATRNGLRAVAVFKPERLSNEKA